MVATLTSPGATQTRTRLVECTGCNGGKDCGCNCLNYCEDCGMVKCRAHRELKYKDGTLNTEHRREYTEKSVPREGGKGNLPGKGYVDSLGKFYGQTTNKADYTPKKASMERPDNKGCVGPALPFTGQSTYNAYHNGKMGPASDPYRRVNPDYSGKFYGDTTNKADYQGQHADPREGFRPPHAIVNLPFDGASTYMDDFTKKQAAERQRRAKQGLISSVNTQGSTTYGIDYVPLPFSKAKSGVPCCADVKHTATRRDPTTL